MCARACASMCACVSATLLSMPQIIRAPSPEALFDEGRTTLNAYKENRAKAKQSKRRSSFAFFMSSVPQPQEMSNGPVVSSTSAEEQDTAEMRQVQPSSDAENVVHIELAQDDHDHSNLNNCFCMEGISL